jgi:hypothetical protein
MPALYKNQNMRRLVRHRNGQRETSDQNSSVGAFKNLFWRNELLVVMLHATGLASVR